MLVRVLRTSALAVVIAVVATTVIERSGSRNDAAPAPTRAAPTRAATTTGTKREIVPIRPAISKVVLRFVKTAVMRSHANRAALLEGWQLTGPRLKEGTTLREWLAGTSSVVPFPDGAIAPHLQVDRSGAKDALLELALYPTSSTSVRAGVFLIGLHRYGAGPKARWLVDYWAPHGSSSMPAAAG